MTKYDVLVSTKNGSSETVRWVEYESNAVSTLDLVSEVAEMVREQESPFCEVLAISKADEKAPFFAELSIWDRVKERS